ncbi:hypothetical protein DXG01_005785 [Tephrocybe rancida]|nr:hypothetical protein DXG01_005785 [Tephrocybe rancida]
MASTTNSTLLNSNIENYSDIEFKPELCSITLSANTVDCAVTSLNIEVALENGDIIGTLSACIIKRRLCDGQFLEVLDDHCGQEFREGAFAIYDKFGRVHPWLLDQGPRTGTGCWGSELNSGNIIYILEMDVDEQYRSQRLGSNMLKKLIASQYVKDSDVLLCWPSPENDLNMGSEGYKDLKEKLIAFFKKNGFRRIGRTSWFGFSPDPLHPSRSLPALFDAPEQGIEFKTADDDCLSPQEIAFKYPLHSVVINMRGEQVKHAIYHYCSFDPSLIHATDASGMTPVHLAFLKVNPDAVATLLALGGASEMLNTQNKDGMTPLEYLARDMQSSRDFSETEFGLWGGHSKDQLACEFLARWAMNSPTMAYNLQEYIAKRKWGCTCGLCAGGWLSKRMRYYLDHQAGLRYDSMEGCKSLFKDDNVIDDLSDLLGCATDYIPERLHCFLNKTFFQGYQTVYRMTQLFLETTEEPLSQSVIAQLIAGQNGVRFFLDMGGKIDYVFHAITDAAQGFASDGGFEEMVGDDPDFQQLPMCGNDLEFGLVSAERPDVGFIREDCVFRFSEKPAFSDRVVAYFELKVKYPSEKGNTIAKLSACTITRRRCAKGRFLEAINGHSEELRQFTTTLYDKSGSVLPFLLEPGYRRGTGCWGSELNNGKIIYILELKVKQKFRGQGLGSRMLRKLVTSKYVNISDVLMCLPAPKKDQNVGSRKFKYQQEKIMAFFRKNDFRRIGRTDWFGFYPTLAHPSRSLLAIQDANEQGAEFKSDADNCLSPNQLCEKYPLHFAISTRDPLVKKDIGKYKNCFHATDASGMTPIHIAFATVNALAVEALLHWGVGLSASVMSNTHNKDGLTPLEYLARDMHTSRFSETTLGQWNGYSDDQLACEFFAMQKLNKLTRSMKMNEYVARRRWGCTCWSCAGGWLSRRMRFQLGAQIRLHLDEMEDHKHVFKANKFFLKEMERPLSVDAIGRLTAGKDGVDFFFDKGGRIEYAFDAIMDSALKQSYLVDGGFEQMHSSDREFTTLPTCDNDLEFDLVRRMLGA